MKILVVDDEPMQRKSMKIGLRTEGYTVVTADSGAAALDVLQTDPAIGLVITDFLMPGMNGLDLLKALQEVASTVPVVLMTGHGKKDLVVEAWKNNCSGYLEKPFSLEQLVAEIDRIKSRVRGVFSPSPAINLSHLLQKPKILLAAIGNYAGWMRTKGVSMSSLQKDAGQIMEMVEMIGHLTCGQENGGGVRPSQRETIELNAFLEGCREAFQGLGRAKGIRFSQRFSGEKLLVLGDRGRLEQLFTALLINAMDSLQGGSAQSITFILRPSANPLMVDVILVMGGVGRVSRRGWKEIERVVAENGGSLKTESREEQNLSWTVSLPVFPGMSPETAPSCAIEHR